MLLPLVVVVVVVVVAVICAFAVSMSSQSLPGRRSRVSQVLASSPSSIINPKPVSILLSPPKFTPHHHRTSNAGRSSQGATDETCGGGHNSTREL